MSHTTGTRPGASMPETMEIPTSQEPIRMHIIDQAKSTRTAYHAFHGSQIPRAGHITAAISLTEEIKDAVNTPVLVEWCPGCIDENTRRIEARRENERRVAANNARASRRDELLDELRDTARAGDLASMADILDELDELDGVSTAGEA